MALGFGTDCHLGSAGVGGATRHPPALLCVSSAGCVPAREPGKFPRGWHPGLACNPGDADERGVRLGAARRTRLCWRRGWLGS